MNDDLLTVAQAAAELGLTRATLHAAIWRGTLKATKREELRGPVWLITRDALDAYRANSLGQPGGGTRPPKE